MGLACFFLFAVTSFWVHGLCFFDLAYASAACVTAAVCCSDLTARAAAATVTSLTLLAQKRNQVCVSTGDLHCDSNGNY